MSTDVLRRQLNRHLDYVRQLQARGLPPITCAFARVEGELPGRDYRPRSAAAGREVLPFEAVATDALFHPSIRAVSPHYHGSHINALGGSHVYLLFPAQLDRDIADEGSRQEATHAPAQGRNSRTLTHAALSACRRVCEMLHSVPASLPPALADRLGFVRTMRSYSWVEVVFHLGWHFPAHGIEADRYRILAATKEAPFDFPCPEVDLQLGGVRASPDVFPGVIISRLGPISDFLTATVNALGLILEALDGVERGVQPQPHSDFGPLRDQFRQLATAYARLPHVESACVLRLADSFHTPPATDWARIQRGGDGWGIPRDYVLSHLDAHRVVCVLHGPGLEQFHELANRAGALLPCWPAQPYPAVLGDVGSFVRYCDPEQFLWAIHAGDEWNRGLVTDHRGNVERWLGLVFALLMRDRLEHLDLVTRPEDAAGTAMGSPVNAVLTLRGMDLFAASARAIELAGLLPAPVAPPTEPTPDDTGQSAGGSMRPQSEPPFLAILRHAVALLDEAEAGLARFREGEDFAEAVAAWRRWQGRVVGEMLTDAETALRGVFSRNPDAPHRVLPGDLEDLWRNAKSWGPGRAQTREQFEGSPRQTDWRTLLRALESFRGRLRQLLIHLDVDTSWLATIDAGQPVAAPPTASVHGPTPDLPVWDETARVLRFRGQECKRFTKHAPAQEKILAVFQEDGWPEGIDDPLDQGQLARTVESLNDRLRHIRFVRNGAGTGVCWRRV